MAPGAPRTRTPRRGFLLYALLGLLAVVGVLLGALHAMSRQRNRLAHRAAYGRVAEGLAEGAASYLQYLMRQVVTWGDASGTLAPPLDQGSFFAFLLQPPEALLASVRGADADTLFAHWFGEDWDYPVRQLEAAHPGSRLRVGFEVEAEPLYRSSFIDPFEKSVHLGLVIEADYAGVTRRVRRTYAIKVVHPFPPLVTKFSLFADRVPSPATELNVLENDDQGIPSGARFQAPFVLHNTPLGERADRELIAANRANLEKQPPDPWADQATLSDELSKRGYVYLGSASGASEPVVLNLTAGPTLLDPTGASTVPNEAGEFFHLYDPVSQGSFPSFFYLPDGEVPAPLRAPLVPPTGDPRKALINFLFWGFHSHGADALEEAGLGVTLQSPRSSILHLFGNDDDPSRTRVFGPVEQAYVRIAYLGIDRLPEEDDDEPLQQQARDAAGLNGLVFLPRRDAAAPILAHLGSEGIWQDELERMARGEPPLHLNPIPTIQSGLPAPENRNFGADTDGDGRKDVFFDPAHPTVPLDAAVFHYAGLFPDGFGTPDDAGYGYARYMSRVERRPYSQMVDFMTYPGVIPVERHPAFRAWTSGEPDRLFAADQVSLDFGDALHAFYQVRPAFRGDLSRFLESGQLEDIVRARVTVRVPDAATFRRRYPEHPNPSDPTDPTPVITVDDVVLVDKGPFEFPDARFDGRGCVVLGEGDMLLSGGTLPQQHAIPGFVALRGNLVLQGGGTVVGFLAAPRGELVNGDGLPKSLLGTLALGTLRAAPLESGGQLRYDAAGDFTRYRGDAGPSYADHYWAALSDAPVAWSPAE